jgi:hypothetical protein
MRKTFLKNFTSQSSAGLYTILIKVAVITHNMRGKQVTFDQY